MPGNSLSSKALFLLSIDVYTQKKFVNAGFLFGTFVPVYGLGGMSYSDVDIAKEVGAQGIAAISVYWS